MTQVGETLKVPRAGHQLHVEVTGSAGVPLVLLHGFPDNLHLYDELMAHLGDRRVVRFDFLGWGRSDKPEGYPYTADNMTGDLVAVIDHLGLERVVLVAHDASGPPAIDWALLHPHRVTALVLLNTYYHQMLNLRRPPAIALFSTPLLRAAARRLAGQGSDLALRIYRWQVGRFIRDDQRRAPKVKRLCEDFVAAQPAFWRLNNDLLGTVLTRRRRIPDLRRFDRPVRVIFGAEDRSLNPRVARRFAELFPRAELHLLRNAGHFVQVDQPERIAELILSAG